jgi:esterase
MSQLRYRVYGDPSKPVLLVFHGLLGSSRNWHSVGTALGSRFHVLCLDLRNHGQSPFLAPHSYDGMISDILGLMDSKGIGRCHLLGHSMGGKLAMKISCQYPEKVDRLVVVDIAPKTYPGSHDSDYEAMRGLDLQSLNSRKEADEILESKIPDWAKRQFLLTNLRRDEAGAGFRWSVNLEALEANQREIESSPIADSDQFAGPTLFILGGRSRYTGDEDIPMIHGIFRDCRIETIPESGHNPHIEAREAFVSRVASFLSEIESSG